MLKRTISWLVVNGFFASMLYLEVWKGMPQAGWVFNAWTWFSAVMLFIIMVIGDEKAKELMRNEDNKYIPWLATLDCYYDIGILATLVWFGKWWIAVVYLVVYIGSLHVNRLRKEVSNA